MFSGQFNKLKFKNRMRSSLKKIILWDKMPPGYKNNIRGAAGYITDTVRYSFEKSVALSNINYMHILLGMACNVRCIMCHQEEYHSKMDPVIYREKLLPIYPYLKTVILQGGEPTILPQVKEFMDILIGKNPQIRFGMVTNGLMFDEYWRDQFIKYGSFVNFSLNAASEKTYDTITQYGNWGKVISNVTKLVHRKKTEHSELEIRASYVILDENIHELSEFIRFCKELGLDGVRYLFDTRMLPKDKDEVRNQLEEAHLLENEFKNMQIKALDSFEAHALNRKYSGILNCTRPLDSIYVDVDGNVRVCCLLKRIILGNLHCDSIEEMWNNLQAKKARQLIKNKDYRYCGGYCKPYNND